MTNTPCKHLESLISDKRKNPRYEDVHRQTRRSINNLPDLGTNAGTYGSEESFRQLLQNLELTPVEIDVLSLKHVYDYTLLRIGKELGLSYGMVWNIVKQAEKAVKRRFK